MRSTLVSLGYQCISANITDHRQTVTDLQTYPSAVFLFAMAVGLYLVRHRRKKLGLPRSEFRAWDAAVIFTIFVNLYLLVMPWYPPTAGKDWGDVSFWYATYCVTGIAM